ncbi:GTPase Era [Arsenophonus endosymbiont of Lipoptena cervi]|uniref:GTPase Era n=1 Tax=Arsenophonus endosymbiont of Lipoptena cervi TaxID=363258 RepID=UPI00376EC544
MSNQTTYCGFVVIIGKPNVGKSTLINQILGKKISITSRKPQTTRYNILGIDTKNNYQTIYIDTPGLHIKKKQIVNNLIKDSTNKLIHDLELIVFVIEGTNWTNDDERIIHVLKYISSPVLLVINKIDNVINKSILLSHINFLRKKMDFLDIIPISAKKGTYIDTFIKIIQQNMPETTHYFPEKYITNMSKIFLAKEIIREKLMRFLGDELPYLIKVEIEQFIVHKKYNYKINGIIIVIKNSQKKIVIGVKGQKIKRIGIESRIEMEKLFSAKIYLSLWVKVKKEASNNEYYLNSLDYVFNINKI